MKICSKCKNSGEFYKDNKSKDGYGRICKSCDRKRQRNWKRIHFNRKFNIDYRLRHAINQRILDAGIKRNVALLDLLGCSLEEYKIYLENSFTPEMEWSNYGKYWEIDHIKPVASFDLPREMFICFHYTNTQPLSKTENKEKGDGTKVLTVDEIVL